MVATLSKNTAGTSWSLGNERSYDVWGSVRSGLATSGPKGRYVANLGHVADDESGLIYMRARYYEPETGRFVSEDPAYDGGNWYMYARSSPTNYVDQSGHSASAVWTWFGIGAMLTVSALGIAGAMSNDQINVQAYLGSPVNRAASRTVSRHGVAMLLAAAAVAAFALSLNATGNMSSDLGAFVGTYLPTALGLYGGVLAVMLGVNSPEKLAGRMASQASGYSTAVMAYGFLCLGILLSMEFD